MVTPPRKDAPRSVTVLGSTGSIGTNTVALLLHHRERFVVDTLCAGRNAVLLAEQARALNAKCAVIADESQYPALKNALSGTGIETAAGTAAVVDAAARGTDWVMAAIVGAAGLEATLAAAKRGAIIAFANKEVLVCAGDIMMRQVREAGATLLPVDSEHSAIYQVLDKDRPDAIARLILTASGGPFRQMDRTAMARVTPEMAVKHPNWSMGAKISVDSATMMNKGLELIEAHHLFAMPQEKIDIVVHPQSVVHSLVEYVDGSVLAQLGTPDMKTPISFALGWPERLATPAARLDLLQNPTLTFEKPDPISFPALRLAREALAAGGTAPAILNAANEVAVAAFLEGRIGFLAIESIVEDALSSLPSTAAHELAAVTDADRRARQFAETRTRKVA